MGFITGLHPDYHTVYDRPEKINYVKMEKITRLVYQVSWEIANADAPRRRRRADRSRSKHPSARFAFSAVFLRRPSSVIRS
jgi:hypothetical protein